MGCFYISDEVCSNLRDSFTNTNTLSRSRSTTPNLILHEPSLTPMTSSKKKAKIPTDPN